jgi:hydrogenase maturation protein HypF
MPGLDARQAVLDIAADVRAGVPVGVISARFHAGLARAAADALAGCGVELAVLSGGAFQNRVLLTATADHLRAAGMRVLIPRALPPNDGGVAFGQAAIAAARTSVESR